MFRRSLTRCWLPCLVVLATATAPACAAETPLYERPPNDLVVLNKANHSAKLEVLPLANRDPRATAQRSGDLRAVLLDGSSEEVSIPYSTIERVELFEQRLLSEAKQHVSQGDFDGAYGYFARLDRDYPKFPGFAEAFTQSIYDEARARFRDGEHDHALALLQTLHEREPSRAGLARAVDTIGDAIVRARWEAEDYVSVRRAVDAVESQFAGLRLSLGERWLDRIAQGAGLEREKAQRLADAGRMREALHVLSGALALDPESPETRRLAAQLSSADKTLWVGVWEAAPRDATPNLDTPAARRQSRLTGGRIATLDAYQPAGGQYGTSLGSLEVDDGRQSLTIRPADGDTADAIYRLARAILDPASSPRDPLALLRGQTADVAVDAAGSLKIDLIGPHPQPEALVTCSLPRGVADAVPGEWRRVDPPSGSNVAARYERASGRGAFDTIEEYVYADLDEAVAALRSRQIHLLADVPPWRLSTVAKTPGVSLTSLRLPTLHCLLMHPETPLRRRREVRRALCYAIAREETLKALLLGGEQRDGFELLSAPFPRGLSLSDPLRYAYNDTVEPRPYEPRLAALLLTAARASDISEAEARPEGAPAVMLPTTITLAHTTSPIASRACEAIRQQLEAVGLGVELIQASEQELSEGLVDYDLRYAEITVGEPMVDVWRLLGPDGVAGACSPAMRDGLERVLSARTGRNATAALKDLHQVAYADLPLIPLWQTVEYFAHPSDLRGVTEDSIDLYQSVDAWRVSGGGTP